MDESHGHVHWNGTCHLSHDGSGQEYSLPIPTTGGSGPNRALGPTRVNRKSILGYLGQRLPTQKERIPVSDGEDGWRWSRTKDVANTLRLRRKDGMAIRKGNAEMNEEGTYHGEEVEGSEASGEPARSGKAEGEAYHEPSEWKENEDVEAAFYTAREIDANVCEENEKQRKHAEGGGEEEEEESPLGVFGKFLSLWVLLCMIVGVLIGHFAPAVPEALNKATVAQISIPIAVLIWLMVYPMLLKIDLKALLSVKKNLKPVLVTSGINYLIQPFTMYGLAMLFFKVAFVRVISDPDLQNEYVAGAVILGGSPCTAMVFVWSFLTQGDAAYTLVQVVVNDILIFVFYIPTLMLLLQVTEIPVPWDTALLSVAIFMVAPGALAIATRWYAMKRRSKQWLYSLVKKFKYVTIVALLGTIVLIFTFQGSQIWDNPVNVLLIAVPLTIQSYLIFALAYGIFYKLQTPFRYAAPGAMIATSNFFELAVAVAMSLFGADSGATLVTVVGVLEEVPIMLSLVWFANKTQHYFPN